MQGDYPRAAAAYESALGIDPGLAAAHHGLGTVRMLQTRFEEAIPHLERTLQLDPGRSEALLALAEAQEQVGRRAAARATYASFLGIWTGSEDLKEQARQGLARLASP